MESESNTAEETSLVQQSTAIIQNFFEIEKITLGRSQDNVLAVYQGKLTRPSEEAYDYAENHFQPLEITPLFRKNHHDHLVILREGLIQPKSRKTRINILLFVLTFFSVIFAGLLSTYSGPITGDLAVLWENIQPVLGETLGFAVSLLGILTAHEFGHYFAARIHKTKVTLPYFIPFPLSPFGTMGAFIQLQQPPKNKKVLLDIGLAGPLAGLVITIPVLIYGLSLSTVERLPLDMTGYFLEGNSLLYLGLKYLIHGKWLPEPVSFQGLQPFVYWVRYFFTGMPFPNGGWDVTIHQVAWAGWAGLLITSLNLIPAGQLDGGHLVYSLFGKRAKSFWPFILGILVVLGFVWSGWWLWAFLILIFGRTQAEPLDEITDLDPARVWMARFGLLIFILVFIPVPLITF